MEQFGKYALVRKIGSGGMAEVYLARTTVAQGLNKLLVIKKIHTAYARSRQFVTMFIDEAKIALGLNHPNIIQVFDFGAVGDTYFLAMEYVEGIDLLRLLQECAKAKLRIPYGLSAHTAQQVAKGLDYAHRKTDEYGDPLAIVHRDISPQNVLLSWDGGVKIVDFGIARARGVQEEEGVIKGKFAYMSPEQARGEPVDCRSDVFATGIVLFEMVCARPLFHGKGKEALEMVKSGVIPRPAQFAPELPENLERIILKALAFDREDRYDTARDLQNDLGRFQLEWAQRHGSLIDSGALAQLLAQLVPADQRIVTPRPPAEGARSPRDDSSVSAFSVVGAHATPAGPQPSLAGSQARTVQPGVASTPGQPEARDRKYVYVLEGALRGVGALVQRTGEEVAARLVREFHRVARDVAFKHEALVDQPRADDVSVNLPDATLRVIVGLPMSGDGDATRAIRLALALVDALDGIGSDVEPELRLALAIQRGTALVARTRRAGRVLDVELEEGTAAFAQKLARQARGAEILVGGRVFRAARGEWNFEALPAIDLPSEDTGVSNVVGVRQDEDTDPGVRRARVYRLRGPKERAARLKERTSDGALHGRDLELKAIRDAYRDVVVARKKRQIMIVGEAGVGKRTLVRAFLDGLAPSEATVVRTASRVGAAMTPYGVIADLARDVLGLAEDAEPHEVERRVLRALPLVFPGEEQGPEARAALQIFGRLLGARSDNRAQATSVGPDDADARRHQMVEILRRVERHLHQDKSLLLIGEDMHWADHDSQQLFSALLRSPTARPVLSIMTARPEPRLLALAKELGTEIIFLDELGEESRRRLVTERFAPDDDVAELAEQIVARAGGNPFFIGEILDTLTERGVVVADQGHEAHPGKLRWTQRDAPLHVPSTVEDLLVTRIDHLTAMERDTLLYAAILGRHVGSSMVSALLGRPARLELDELVRRGLLAPAESDYKFKNDMTMTVAYGLLHAEVRARLHRTAASRIAGSPGYRLGQDDAEIARHLELAGDHAAAADRYLRASTHAIELGGHADAFRQLTRVLKLLPPADHARRFEVHRHRAEILERLARRPQQLRELHAMRREAEALSSPVQLALAFAELAQFYIDVGKAPAAARAAVPALEHAEQSGDKLAIAEALRLRSAIARLVGNADEALRLAEQALGLCDAAMAQHTGDTPPPAVLRARAVILNNRGTTLWAMGRLEAAIESYAEALVIYQALGMSRPEARALNNMGIVFAALGEYDEALAHYKRGIKIDQSLGERGGLALKLGNIGQCYADLGDFGRAESYLTRALDLAEQTGDQSTAADAAVSLGQVHLGRDDHAAALAHFEQGLGVATGNRDRYQEVRALEYIALAHLMPRRPGAGTADPEGALELARSATELARKMPMHIGIIHGLTFQALALAALGRLAEARTAIDEAWARTQPSPSSRTEGFENLQRWRAEVLTALGDPDAAAEATALAAAETDTKAARLRDPELRRTFLGSRSGARSILG